MWEVRQVKPYPGGSRRERIRGHVVVGGEHVELNLCDQWDNFKQKT